METSLFSAAAQGFVNILQLKVFLAMMIGVSIGTFTAVAPQGLGMPLVYAIALPIVIKWEPLTGIALLIGAFRHHALGLEHGRRARRTKADQRTDRRGLGVTACNDRPASAKRHHALCFRPALFVGRYVDQYHGPRSLRHSLGAGLGAHQAWCRAAARAAQGKLIRRGQGYFARMVARGPLQFCRRLGGNRAGTRLASRRLARLRACSADLQRRTRELWQGRRAWRHRA